MIRVACLAAFCLSPAVGSEPVAGEAPAHTVSRIAFGSCCRQDRPVPIFGAVAAFRPDVWIWMGDNIYGDTDDMEKMAEKYAALAAKEPYAALRKTCPVIIGTWDDHDYGENDAGREFPQRAASQQRFLDFFGVPANDPRRQREGVYASHVYGPPGRRVKVILLDTRYHRDRPGTDGDVLGEAQWAWLESELRDSPAQVHLLVSSIQLVASEHRFEKWENFPSARRRLLTLLARPDIPPVTILSGDRHLGEISVERTALPYPLYDITSSSLNQPMGGRKDEINRHRLGANYGEANFGTLEIDWSAAPPTLRFALRSEVGAPVRSVEIRQGR